MAKRTVVVRRPSCNWRPIKTKEKQNIVFPKLKAQGFISPIFVVLLCSMFAGFMYIYSINQTAIKGIEMRKVEKDLSAQKDANVSLKIKEAELKSLYKIEEASKNLNMIQVQNPGYLEENQSVAYGKK